MRATDLRFVTQSEWESDAQDFGGNANDETIIGTLRRSDCFAVYKSLGRKRRGYANYIALKHMNPNCPIWYNVTPETLQRLVQERKLKCDAARSGNFATVYMLGDNA